MERLIKTSYKSNLGALSIVFGTVLSNNMNHEYLSPLMFSLGIILIIILDLDLITRAIPSGAKMSDCLIIGACNLLFAFFLGMMLKDFGNFPDAINGDFCGAMATGIIIGLVSLVNKEKSNYTVPVTLMLMFSFVYLKLPHCVVCAFYLGTIDLINVQGLINLGIVVSGNIMGGVIIRLIYKSIKLYIKEKEKES